MAHNMVVVTDGQQWKKFNNSELTDLIPGINTVIQGYLYVYYLHEIPSSTKSSEVTTWQVCICV